MECFTFLRMGGDLDRIEVTLIANPDKNPSEARHELKEQFAHFDAAEAQCFLPKDKHRLLAVVEAGFGTFQDFNTCVRTAFAERLDAPPSRTMRKLFSTKKSLTVKATLASAGQVELASAEVEGADEVQQEAV